jgi:hypothetical protein
MFKGVEGTSLSEGSSSEIRTDSGAVEASRDQRVKRRAQAAFIKKQNTEAAKNGGRRRRS